MRKTTHSVLRWWIIVVSFGLFQSLVSEAQSTNCVQPTMGLISWWRGEGNGLDAQGINHGAVMGGGGFTNAMVGRGFVFSGSGDDYIGLPPNVFPMPPANEISSVRFAFQLWS